MKHLVAAASLFILIGTGCGNTEEKKADKEKKEKDQYEQTKETLEETEKKNPVRFLAVEGKDHRNLLRQTVIKGTITNKATVARYKDIDVELAFYSKTGALLEKDHEVIYETISPGTTADFKTKYYAPKGTDSIALKIIAAKTD